MEFREKMAARAAGTVPVFRYPASGASSGTPDAFQQKMARHREVIAANAAATAAAAKPAPVEPALASTDTDGGDGDKPKGDKPKGEGKKSDGGDGDKPKPRG